MLLVGCGEAVAPTESTTKAVETTTAFVPASITATTADEGGKEETKLDLENMRRDPPYDYNIDEMQASDFGDFFKEDFGSTVSEYKLLEDTDYENDVLVIKGEKEGPSVYVIAGIHGDEEAAWQSGKLLKKISISAGTLYILAPANRWGAYASTKKRSIDGADPNRAFPGDLSGNGTQRVAASIYNDVKDKNPDFVFDLHEATIVSSERDYLGSSYIYSDASLFGELLLDLVDATETGKICNRPFTYYGPGPSGSINRTITEKLGLPVLTIETFRGFEMEDRIHDQLDSINFVLNYFGML